MKQIPYFFIFVALFFLNILKAQGINEEKFLIISQIDESVLSDQNSITSSNYIVRIQQIGNNNSANATSYGSGIEMNLLQRGDDNYIESIVGVEDYKLNASQNGDNNYFSNIPIFSQPGTQLEVIQEGNNQHVENNGANAISKNMSIRITGDNRMLTIQNIN